MPAELFRSVSARPRSSGRRFGAVPLSVVVHVAIVLAAAVIPLFAIDELPMPWTGIGGPFPIVPVVVPNPPAPPPPRGHVPILPAATKVIPLEAPNGIAPPSNLATPPPDVLDISTGGTIVGVPAGQAIEVAVPPPPPPAPKPAVGPLKAGIDIDPPRRIHYQAPVYPAFALQARIQGTVVIEAVIATDGTVKDMRVVQSVQLLDQAALDAVRNWVYTPTRLRGVAVPVVMNVSVTFRLQ